MATGALRTMTISSLTPLAAAAGLLLTAGLLTVTFTAEPSTTQPAAGSPAPAVPAPPPGPAIAAAGAAPAIPSLDGLLEAGGYDLRWKVDDQGRTQWRTPRTDGSPFKIPAVLMDFPVIPGQVSDKSPWKSFLSSIIPVCAELMLSGTEDLASRADLDHIAFRLGWDRSDAGLATRLAAPVKPGDRRAELERLVAARLLQHRNTPAARAALAHAGTIKERWLAAALQPASKTTRNGDLRASLASLGTYQDVVLVLQPERYALLPGGTGAVCSGSELAIILKIHEMGPRLDIQEMFANLYEVERVRLVPFEFARAYGNLRISRLVLTAQPSESETTMALRIEGQGLEAIARAGTGFGVGKPVAISATDTLATIHVGKTPSAKAVLLQQPDDDALLWMQVRLGALPPPLYASLGLQPDDVAVLRLALQNGETILTVSIPGEREAVMRQIATMATTALNALKSRGGTIFDRLAVVKTTVQKADGLMKA